MKNKQLSEKEFKNTIYDLFYGKEETRNIKIPFEYMGVGARKMFDEAMKKEVEKRFGKIFTPEEIFQQELFEARKIIYEDTDRPDKGTPDSIQSTDGETEQSDD